MAPPALTLITIAEFKDAMNWGNSADFDDQLAIIGAAVESQVKLMTGREFLKATYTELRRVEPTDTLYVRESPIISVTSLKEDDETIDTDYYYIESYGRTRIIMDEWYIKGKVEIVYEGGYDGIANVPYDLKMGMYEIIKYLHGLIENGMIGLKQISGHGETLSIQQYRLPKESLDKILQYKCYAV